MQIKVDNPLKGKTKFGWHFKQNVYAASGIVRALKSSEGSGNIPKVIVQVNEHKNSRERNMGQSGSKAE